MIAQRFEFTRDFPKAWNNSVYFQLRTSVPFRVKCLVDSKIKRGFVCPIVSRLADFGVGRAVDQTDTDVVTRGQLLH